MPAVSVCAYSVGSHFQKHVAKEHQDWSWVAMELP